MRFLWFICIFDCVSVPHVLIRILDSKSALCLSTNYLFQIWLIPSTTAHRHRPAISGSRQCSVIIGDSPRDPSRDPPRDLPGYQFCLNAESVHAFSLKKLNFWTYRTPLTSRLIVKSKVLTHKNAHQMNACELNSVRCVRPTFWTLKKYWNLKRIKRIILPVDQGLSQTLHRPPAYRRFRRQTSQMFWFFFQKNHPHLS